MTVPISPNAPSVLFPVGMLGGGFPASTVDRGIELGADIIAVDGGSTDSGPYYLGTARAKTARAAVKRDLDILLRAAKGAGIPLVVGSCGTSGTDAGVDWVYGIATEICAEAGLTATVARIYSEQDPAALRDRLKRDTIKPLPPAKPLEAATLERCRHIVGLMGAEPIADALRGGADVVLAGRATDTALAAVLPLMRGTPAGLAWHAAKIAECGGLCTENPRAGGVLVTVGADAFTIEPLAPEARATPRSVAAHMLYENADPFRLREPAGTLDTSGSRYEAADDRIVRVTGSRFEPAEQKTIKLEGSASAGFQTRIISGIRDPEILASLDTWCEQVLAFLRGQVSGAMGLTEGSPGEGGYALDLRRFGHDAILGPAEPFREQAPRKAGIMLTVTAADQATATEVAKIANPLLLHAPIDFSSPFPSFAFVSSPAEIECGESFEFLLNHAVDVDDERELFRTVTSEVGA